MSLCQACVAVGLTVANLRDQDLFHHENLQSLRDSGDRGCPFCSLCWKALERAVLRSNLEARLLGNFPPGCHPDRNTKIWLRGEFHDWGPTVYRSTRSKVIVSCGIFPGYGNDPVASDSTEAIFAFLSVFAEPGTPAADGIMGRWSSSTRNPGMYAQLAHAWITDCERLHPRCKIAQGKVMPTRVIHVGTTQQNPRLVITDGLREPYVALSYCWGAGVQMKVKLLGSTLVPYQTEMSWKDMTRTHQEAIQVTRELGYQYIWIDALCIIQKNPQDWEAESKKMGQVYGNASLTLVTGRSSHSDNGFLENKLDDDPEPFPMPYHAMGEDSTSTGVAYVSLPRGYDKGATESRAWCFQEDILSHRMLGFAKYQMFFRCQDRISFEDGQSVVCQPGQESQFLVRSYGLMRDPAQIQRLKHEMIIRWYQILANYTMTSMWDPHDVFPAMTGIAQRLQSTLASRYLAGVWECDVIRGLLWRPRYRIHVQKTIQPLEQPVAVNPRRPDPTGQSTVRAPSWSWASLSGPIWYQRNPRTDAQKYSETNFRIKPRHVHPVRWTWDVNGDASELSMPRCKLEVSGSPRKVTLSQQPVSGYPGRLPMSYSRGKMNQAANLLEGTDTGDEHVWLGACPLPRVVAFAIFDIPVAPTSVPTLWCMRLIGEEGLILEHDSLGGFRRLGVFGVSNQTYFDLAVEQEVNLV